MAAPKWSLTAKICGSCKTSAPAVFCSADTAFLCTPCDAKVHAVNKLAPRHARVWLCEQAPASVTCKADAAALCTACDRDIHSANPLPLRHERVPIAPFYGAADRSSPSEDEEAEAWLIPNLNADHGGVDLEEDSRSPEYKSAEYLFRDMDPYVDLDLFSGEQKAHEQKQQQQLSLDGVVPEHTNNRFGYDQYPAYEMDHPGPKHIMFHLRLLMWEWCRMYRMVSTVTKSPQPRCPGSTGRRGYENIERRERVGGSKKPFDMHQERHMPKPGQESKDDSRSAPITRLSPSSLSRHPELLCFCFELV
ncbi:zinc finger protein CONSTANS-LIKE 4-like isoform X2 [Primulina huaijiensis]|uniref:zinc finger protein CONSTANS-LIKE 4-like isoform X2 n=1 Tax=Primulina huaijiensis TaxID=1492673 RepID=UPI003CC70577